MYFNTEVWLDLSWLRCWRSVAVWAVWAVWAVPLCGVVVHVPPKVWVVVVRGLCVYVKNAT